MAHGASVHHELQLLVTAGLTPVQALRAATARPRADSASPIGAASPRGPAPTCYWSTAIPTTTIADTLSIRAVWRRGARQAPA